MSDEFTLELFQNAVEKHIAHLKEHGTSDEKIANALAHADFSKPFDSVTEQMAMDSVSHIESTMYERILEIRAQTAEFLARNEQLWGKCFVASETMYTLVLETIQAYNNYLKHQPKEYLEEKRYTIEALSKLHGRACQQFLEITYLLKLGFADGAYARWRSLYELSIITEFISDNGEAIAHAYCDAASADNNWYDWAKEYPKFSKKKHIRFADIQKECSSTTEEWLVHYKLANRIVHATPNGTFGRLGQPDNIDENNYICAGHSDYGLACPAVNAAISLCIVTTLYLTVVPYGDGIVALKCILKWVDIVEKFYSEVEKTCFNNTDIPRRTRIDGSKI